MLAIVAYLSADWAVRVQPGRVVDGLARRLARLFFGLRPPARRQLETNLSQLLGGHMPERGRTPRVYAREAFEHFALSLADFLRLARLAPGALAPTVEKSRDLPLK